MPCMTIAVEIPSIEEGVTVDPLGRQQQPASRTTSKAGVNRAKCIAEE